MVPGEAKRGCRTLELGAVLSHLTWVLEADVGSSAGAAYTQPPRLPSVTFTACLTQTPK